MDHVPGVGRGAQAGPVDVVDRVEALREEPSGPTVSSAIARPGTTSARIGVSASSAGRSSQVVARHAFEEVSAHKVNGRRPGLNLTPGSRESYGRDRREKIDERLSC
jgi:hypothetical protein